MYAKVLSVTTLNSYIKKNLDNDFILSNAYVSGEISNFKLHSSGHIYFSLKDETSKINCVMFKGNGNILDFIPKDGSKVVIKGRVSVYLKEGSYQLYCDEMKLQGIGELYAAFLKLKAKLEKEGYFEISHKRPIPSFIDKIGIVTSPTGAAIRDIINVIKRRNKGVNILIYPTQVQGINASKEIIKGIEYFNTLKDIDVIILARGGGSIEELWSFNDEDLAHEVYSSKIPIITGVGHETDFTIVDFVSDRRAPTPSAAAEIAVFNVSDISYKVMNIRKKLYENIKSQIDDGLSHISQVRSRLKIAGPENYIVNQYSTLELYKERLNKLIALRFSSEGAKLSRINGIINAHNPLNVLKRGYAILQDKNSKVIGNIGEILVQDTLNITLADGTVKVDIINQEVI